MRQTFTFSVFSNFKGLHFIIPYTLFTEDGLLLTVILAILFMPVDIHTCIFCPLYSSVSSDRLQMDSNRHWVFRPCTMSSSWWFNSRGQSSSWWIPTSSTDHRDCAISNMIISLLLPSVFLLLSCTLSLMVFFLWAVFTSIVLGTFNG